MTREPGTHPRRQDWPERLSALVEARRHAAFTWGVHDCAMFAADAVLLMTGRDPLAEWRGRYGDEAEGDALTEAMGGFELFMSAAFARFGAPECPSAMTQRGDVALVAYGNTRSLGIILGGSVAVPGLDRLSFLPTRLICRAWAI